MENGDLPEPGIPETAIRRRSDGDRDRNFAGPRGQLLNWTYRIPILGQQVAGENSRQELA